MRDTRYAAASHCPYAMHRRNTQYAARLTLPIRNTQTQYAIRRPPHTAHTQYTNAIRNTQPAAQLPVRNAQTRYALRSPPQVSLLIRNTQYANTMRNAQSASSLSRARNPQHTNAIRDTRWPPRAAFSAGNWAQYAILNVHLDPQRPQQHPRSPCPYAIQPLHTQYLHTQRLS